MQDNFDVIIIGGGATGLGSALEAVSRGYKTLLLEAEDFGKGTSSKSTKLVHGGIRYLANLDFALVKEGLHERYYFLNNAPHLAKKQSYMVPLYSFFEKVQYFVGIKLYDLLAGSKKIGKSKFLNYQNVINDAPQLKKINLKGGAIYFDGQFDDTRMLISLLKTFQSLGGIALNYNKVTSFIKNSDNKVIGVNVLDKTSSINKVFYSKVCINATGTMTDNLLNLANPNIEHKNVTAAQGTHLVFDKEIFNSEHAIVIPKTIDNRILFVLPWHDKVIVGTTDIKIDNPTLDPLAMDEEIKFILDTLNQYTLKKVTREDIKSIFAGQRPLVKSNKKSNSSKISRKHEILYDQSGLISIVGGKWTIYRLMGQDVIDFAIKKNLLNFTKSISKNLHLFGYTLEKESYPLSAYGSEKNKIKEIQVETNNYLKIHESLPYYQAEVLYQCRFEMVKCIEDVLVRRTRAIFLDAKAAIEAASVVANLMASELKKDNEWVLKQIEEFTLYAKKYIVK